MPNPSQGVALWFTYLRDFQSDCAFDTNVAKMDLLTFANSKIIAVLPSDNEKNQFIVAAKSSPGFDISISQLTTYSTFEALLDHFNPLTTYVGVLLQGLSAAPYPSGAAADFWKAKASSAFPGGSAGTQWNGALSALASAIPAVCFTQPLQTKINALIDKAGSAVSDVISAIAVLG
jgi:hypothetical protein